MIHDQGPLGTFIIDLSIAIGKGQRCLMSDAATDMVKTVFCCKICQFDRKKNHPLECYLIVLLIR